MNQKELTMGADVATPGTTTASRSEEVLRKLLIKVLQHASEGHFLLRERGRVIAEIGDRESPLQAEANVLDTRVYKRVLLGGNAAAGEAYTDGWWTSPDISEVTRFFARNLSMMDYWDSRFGWLFQPLQWMRMLKRRNSKQQAKRNILAHYDLGNDLYTRFLDPRLQYSSALYESPQQSLQQAQESKLRRICEKLELNADDHLLEVGSGWGGLAIYAASNYGCRVTTTTISDAQYVYAQAAIAEAGLNDRITLLNRDYRLLEGQYDKLVSVEMIEAVGRSFLSGYFEKLNELIKPGGKLMLQAITIADQRLKAYGRSEDFIQRHIFPGGYLPSLQLISQLMARKTDFVIRNVRDMGLDYARTLADWHNAFLANWNELESLGYDQRFRNLWEYYLGYCEGGFRERRISAVQLLATKAPHAL